MYRDFLLNGFECYINKNNDLKFRYSNDKCFNGYFSRWQIAAPNGYNVDFLYKIAIKRDYE